MLLNNYLTTLYNILTAVAVNNDIIENLDNITTRASSVPSTHYNSGSTRDRQYFPNYRGIVFGSGTTPPQKTDYKIENHIANGLTYSNNSTSLTNNVVNWVQTVQNTSGEPITISEVGLFSAYGPSSLCVLLTRTVLDNPVVLQPNEVKTFTITMDYNKFVDGTIIQNE
jgi:hypothetical protein